jgi:hypothetical protein
MWLKKPDIESMKRMETSRKREPSREKGRLVRG